MTKFLGGKTQPLLALMLVLAGSAAPLAAQDSADNRLRRLEAEVRDLKRQAGAERTVAPQATPSPAAPRPVGAPASTPVSDLMSRMEAIEGQLARLTAQNEEGGNKLRQLEERIAASEAAAKAANATQSATTTSSLGQGDAVPAEAVAAPPARPPATRPASASAPTAAPAAVPASPARPARPTGRPAAPSAQRVAAVRAIVKPETTDVGEDEYTYGFRLWEAKFYPEAQQQLKLFLDKYPRHGRVSYARNLMGRALLSDGKPREAASWFLQNYEANKQGDRAPDSLLFLAEAMNQLKDSSRACIALGEFAKTYPKEAAGRLKSQYDATRSGVKCD
ncbi:MAG: tetratricopeptide repeat protein [Novosphingobium sp.]